MSNGDIFYSNVDANLRKELYARANAGFTSRTNKDLNFMLGKIGNVEISAYDGNDPATKKLVSSEGADDNQDPFAVLGGKTSLTGSYLPSGPNGFLTQNNSFRIPPVITSAEIDIGDHTMGLLNKATINITIPDPVRDFDSFERIWFRPGRHSTIIFEHPDSAIITENLLTDESVPSEEKLAQQFPEKTSEIQEQLKKMNRIRFDGLITSFQFTYQTDGSVECTLSLTGTSNVYTDVSMLIQKETGSANTTSTGNDTFYSVISKLVDGKIKEVTTDTITSKEIIIDNLTDRSIIFGPGLTQNVNSKAQQSTYRYITLGYLVDLINRNIINKHNVVDTPEVICNDAICRSNVYNELVSADPSKLLLWPGTTDYTINQYSKILGITWLDSVEAVTEGFYNIPPDDPGTIDSIGFPSRIYIEMETIKVISDNAKTVNDLFKSIGELIYSHTGGSINMSLITHPTIPKALLYYDTKFLGINKEDITEFAVPMFAQSKVERNTEETVLGTIVSDLKISSKLPDNMKNLAYVLNEGTEISESDIAPFVAYMYADSEQREKLEENYKETHKKYLLELSETKLKFSQDPTSGTAISRLKKSLIKYIQYPTEDIMLSNKLSAPIYPFDVQFTIDGINGFKYGDVLEIPILPSRYSQQTVFSVIQVTHSIDATGLWQTKIKCIMRPRITN